MDYEARIRRIKIVTSILTFVIAAFFVAFISLGLGLIFTGKVKALGGSAFVFVPAFVAAACGVKINRLKAERADLEQYIGGTHPSQVAQTDAQPKPDVPENILTFAQENDYESAEHLQEAHGVDIYTPMYTGDEPDEKMVILVKKETNEMMLIPNEDICMHIDMTNTTRVNVKKMVGDSALGI